jgi:hypothetical protein
MLIRITLNGTRAMDATIGLQPESPCGSVYETKRPTGSKMSAFGVARRDESRGGFCDPRHRLLSEERLICGRGRRTGLLLRALYSFSRSSVSLQGPDCPCGWHCPARVWKTSWMNSRCKFNHLS